ncbi:hypothetical protein DL769_008626 [Monosporascus sp. CRB-8-3]|nr:hypothetical protein DL769_008626 [Monosporascus sp. CRB-8-3]
MLIIVGSGVASPTDRLENTQFTADEVRAVSEVARSYGTWVTVRYMAERGVRLTPTLMTYDAIASDEVRRLPGAREPAEEPGGAGAGAALHRDRRQGRRRDVLRIRPARALPAERSREFGIRARVLSSKEVLQRATVNAARMPRQDGFLGPVKAGFAADVLILSENPLDDVSILDNPKRHVLVVIKNGRAYESR